VPTGPRHLTRRQIAYLSPRLGLLNNLSMAVPFQTRVEVFREFIKSDRRRHGLTLDNYGYRRNSHRVDIRRTHLAEDGFKKLNRLGPGLKSLVQITFIDQWGNEEEGIDGGGLFKEFLTALSKEAFDTERGLWLSNYNNELYPNPHSYARESDQLQWYSFLGRVLGKALYEDILVDVSFAGFFCEF
jgi:ubiquitin-protein ligase E3 C